MIISYCLMSIDHNCVAWTAAGTAGRRRNGIRRLLDDEVVLVVVPSTIQVDIGQLRTLSSDARA